MSSFIITGGKGLYGSVRLGGAKNASFKLMIASLLSTGESRLLNFSHIRDVEITRNMIEDLGGNIRNVGERTLLLCAKHLSTEILPEKYGILSRASTMFLGPLLMRFGHAVVPLPGGDAIGKRPIDRHLKGLEALGATMKMYDHTLEAWAKDGLHGARYRFEKVTHTGTESMILAAVCARGKTILENAGLEPEIDDLIEFLIAMGAQIRRKPNRVIEIEGVRELHSAIHKIMPDRNEAVSYACAAIATRGDIIVENAKQEHLRAFLDKLDAIGAEYEVGAYGIRFFAKEPLRATDVETAPHPGFMTDWQPLWAVLLTQIDGTSMIHETVSERRFQYVHDLVRMGAKIETFSPRIKNPNERYQFPYDPQDATPHAIKVTGKTPLQAGTFEVPDIRAGATLVLAALIAPGTTTLHSIDHIDRGYEQFDSRLRSLGAEIVRI